MNAHGEQQYTLIGHLGEVYFEAGVKGLMMGKGNTLVYLCQGCGALVGDKNQHNEFHSKTRSAV
jgi:hypothetical protein